MHERKFLELLHQEEGKLFYIAWGILGQESDAWDVLQQTVEKAWRNRNKLKGGNSAFPAWIRRILINQCLDTLRINKKTIPVEPSDLVEMLSGEVIPEGSAIWEVVALLDQEHRQVLFMRYLGDLALKDIAMELQIPIGTVKSRLNRALKRLKEKLEEDEGPRRELHELR
ncbi:RNA polymerase sigma factor [Desulfoscipio gibsoniae]|uniref:RNA polymerase sigma factor, sigma-70 family n=1 Tax=Desulfoscipio gibsoniae DSM 7213 TaxID=767817 RepID=R4KPH7_9FIRM|nr:RNA polymerase sigma factor [Desulfoscipio gibsoniae]AGL02490.1 RNA polymerase sigma factor, sigma-70 family [Desulfoscipio gibsoniae DSM 7213]